MSVAPQLLAKVRALVVEDAAVIATKIARVLRQAGATVVGPIGTLDDALETVAGNDAIDVALVDVDLRGRSAFPLCQALADRGTRFMLITGYDLAAIPLPWSRGMVIHKPFQSDELVRGVLALLAAPAPDAALGGASGASDIHDRRRADPIRDVRNSIMVSRVLIDESQELRAQRQAGELIFAPRPSSAKSTGLG